MFTCNGSLYFCPAALSPGNRRQSLNLKGAPYGTRERDPNEPLRQDKRSLPIAQIDSDGSADGREMRDALADRLPYRPTAVCAGK